MSKKVMTHDEHGQRMCTCESCSVILDVGKHGRCASCGGRPVNIAASELRIDADKASGVMGDGTPFDNSIPGQTFEVLAEKAPTTRKSKIKVCDTCHGRIWPESLCVSCLGSGWVWADGVPPTVCPGGGAQASAASIEMGRDVTDLPCGRTGEKCPGCDRFSADIGTTEDRARTVEWQAVRVKRPLPRLLPNDIEHLDPGIQDLVFRLRAFGINTTDSGDGVSKLPGGHWERLGFQAYDPADVVPYPHVVMVDHDYLGVGVTLSAFLRIAGDGWTFDISVLPDPLMSMMIVAYKKPKEDEADRAHTREQLATQLAEMERACVDGQAEIEALRARVVSLHERCLRLDGGAGFDGACVECVGIDEVPEHLRDFRCWRHTPLPLPVDGPTPKLFTRADLLKAFCVGQSLHTNRRITVDSEGNEWTRGGEPLLHFAWRVVNDTWGTTEPCTCHTCVQGREG